MKKRVIKRWVEKPYLTELRRHLYEFGYTKKRDFCDLILEENKTLLKITVEEVKQGKRK